MKGKCQEYYCNQSMSKLIVAICPFTLITLKRNILPYENAINDFTERKTSSGQ